MTINFNNKLGRRALSFALAGTLVTFSVAMSERTMNDKDSGTLSGLAYCYYYDEDVKKNRQMIFERITRKGNGENKVGPVNSIGNKVYTKGFPGNKNIRKVQER